MDFQKNGCPLNATIGTWAFDEGIVYGQCLASPWILDFQCLEKRLSLGGRNAFVYVVVLNSANFLQIITPTITKNN